MLLFVGSPAYAVSLAQLIKNAGLQQPTIHKLAPSFSLLDLDGNHVALADFRGEWVLLHFWATWCMPCRHEMPLLHALENDGINAMRIVCINVDRGDKSTVKAFMHEVTPNFHTLLDPEGVVRNQYAIRGLPTTYVIDPEGKIMGRMIGERDWSSAAMKEMLQRLLNDQQH